MNHFLSARDLDGPFICFYVLGVCLLGVWTGWDGAEVDGWTDAWMGRWVDSEEAAWKGSQGPPGTNCDGTFRGE